MNAELHYRTDIDEYKERTLHETNSNNKFAENLTECNDSFNGTGDNSNCGDNLAIDLESCFDNGVHDSKSELTISLAWDNLVKDMAEFARTKGGKIKSAEICTTSYLEKEAKIMINEQSPTFNPIEKLAQLELHECLHGQWAI